MRTVYNAARRLRPRFLALTAALISCLLVVHRDRDPLAGQPRWSVLLVVVDTLRADHLSVYGYDKPTTPVLERLSRRSLVYERALSPAPFTMPAMAALMTGLYPDRTGVNDHSPSISLAAQPAPTLAELARAAGYKTYAVVTNPWLSRRATGFDRGFDVYVTQARDGSRAREFDAAKVTDRAVRLLEHAGDAPFLLWVHYLDPHMPYSPPQAFAEAMGNPSASSAVVRDFVAGKRSKPQIYFSGGYPPAEMEATRQLYDAEIRYVDSQLARLLAALEKSGRADDTVVVFAADHGEALGEHGLSFAHDFTLYDELIRVALLVHRPDLTPARVNEPVSLLDLLPTLCDWLELSCPQGFDGRPLPQTADGGAERRPRTLFAASAPYRARYGAYQPQRLIGLDGRWRMARRKSEKLIEIPQPGGSRWEAYDLSSDPGEASPVDGASGRFGGMRSSLRAWEAEMRAARPPAAGSGPYLSARRREQLRALGYLE